MKLDLKAVEEHAKYVGAVRKENVSWRLTVGSSGLVTLIFEGSQGAPLDVAGVETFEMMSYSSMRPAEQLLH